MLGLINLEPIFGVSVSPYLECPLFFNLALFSKSMPNSLNSTSSQHRIILTLDICFPPSKEKRDFC